MCVFCKIISGDIPSYKVYEDDNFLAILDISQTTLGHTLVMPKKHYSNMLEMPKVDYEQLMGLVQQLAIKITKNLNASGCNILINSNEVAGQTVMHTHVHIIPRYTESDSIKIEFKENKFNLEDTLNKINKA